MSKQGIDWSGLFNWSAKYNDGTKATNFTPMTEEEKIWLEKAMTEYTYNESDRMQEIVKTLFDQENTPESTILSDLEELYDIIETHPRNSVNLENSGGFKLLITTMFSNPSSKVRKLSMEIFSAIVQNTPDLQLIAHGHGALNLMYKYIEEALVPLQEQILGSLSSLLRTSVPSIKQEFFTTMKGLDWLKQVILDPKTSKKSQRKVYFLLYDLIVKETDPSVEK